MNNDFKIFYFEIAV